MWGYNHPEKVEHLKSKVPTQKLQKLKEALNPCGTTIESVYPPPLNYSKLALLVEDRPLPHSTPLLLHFISVVPPEWPFLYLGSKKSIDFLMDSPAIRHQVKMKKLELREMDPRMHVHGHEELSQTFTAKWFYDEVLHGAHGFDIEAGVPLRKERDFKQNDIWHPSPKSPEWLLVFQTDSILCANSKNNINDYLQYDYVGAPWGEGTPYGGNGGLSIRRMSKILAVLNAQQRKPNDPELEDLWLVNRMAKLPGANMPGADITRHFSVEQVWEKDTIGYHTGWSGVRLPEGVWGEPEKRKYILDDFCPEFKMTLELKMPTFREQEDKLKAEKEAKEKKKEERTEDSTEEETKDERK